MQKLLKYCCFFLVLYCSCSFNKNYKINNVSSKEWSNSLINTQILIVDSCLETNNLNITEALNKYDTLKDIAENFKLKEALQNIYRRYGAAYTDLGNLNLAIEFYSKSIAISLEIKDTIAYWSTYSNIGIVYQYFGLNDKAKEYILPAFNYFNKTGVNPYLISNNAHNLSLIFLNLKDYSKAAIYAQLAYDNIRKIKHDFTFLKSDSIRYFINWVSIVEKVNKDEAQKIFFTNEHIVLNESDTFLKKLGLLYASNLFLDKSINNKYFMLSKKCNFKDSVVTDIIEINDLFEKYYLATKNKDSAYHFLKQNISLKDSLYDIEKLKIAANIENLYLMMANKEIKLLESEKRIRNIWIISLCSILTLLFFIVLFILKNHKIKQQKTIAETNLNINKILDNVNQTKMEAWADGQEKERSRLAAELHDRLGGLLVMASHHFSSIEKKFEVIKNENEAAFSDFRKIINNAIIEVRELSKDISSNLVSKLGLNNAMIDLKEKIEAATHLKINLYTHDTESKINLTKEIALFRVAQEALNNILKHAEATEIQLSLVGNEQTIVLMVEDNGKGFNHHANIISGMGIKSMQKRMEDIGGTINIDSTLGRGTIIVAEILI